MFDAEEDRSEWSEEEFLEFLGAALVDHADEEGEDMREPQTFESAGLLTGNQGLVVKIRGCEFQVSVVRSR